MCPTSAERLMVHTATPTQTLKEVLRLPHIWGIDPGHLGVLYAVDR